MSEDVTAKTDQAADEFFTLLVDSTEEIIEETAAETWPSGFDDYWSEPFGTPDKLAHTERTFAAVARALAVKLIVAADSADHRLIGGPS